MTTYKFIQIDDNGTQHELLAIAESTYNQNLQVIQDDKVDNSTKFEAVSSFLPSDIDAAFRKLVGLEPIDT